MLNDAFFNTHIREVEINSDIVSIMKKIDEVEYLGRYRITSKFMKDFTVGVNELSTGCKTAINVYTFPKKIFYAGECGKNALQVIFNFNKGNILIDGAFMPPRFKKDIQVITDTNKIIVKNNSELADIMIKFFNNR